MSFSGELDGKESICNAGAAAAAAKSLQSCPTLFEPLDGSPPGSSVHGIFQARVLEWGAIAWLLGNKKQIKKIKYYIRAMM